MYIYIYIYVYVCIERVKGSTRGDRESQGRHCIDYAARNMLVLADLP